MMIDGVGPMSVVRPGSVTELGEAVRAAAAAGQSVYPFGGGTQLHLGMPPSRAGLAVDCRALDTIIDYPARDMTITVGAGIRLSTLQSALARERQWLPMDVAQAEAATLGGVLAANVSGPRRFGHGTLRDYVIGISAVNDEGGEFKAGGRVVKNVAGYDLCKLLIGSLGTLGIITQATLKLRPLPAASALVLLGVSDESLGEALDRLHQSRTRPVVVDVVDASLREGAALEADRWLLAAGYEGNAEAVAWQVRQVQSEMPGVIEVLEAEEAARGLARLNESAAGPEATFSMKASVLPSAAAEFCRGRRREGGCRLHAHAGSGIVMGHAAGLTQEAATRMLKVWRDTALAAGGGQGRVVVTRSPSAWKRALSVWGTEPANGWLLREVKKQFDPRGLFNPGRLVPV